MGTTISDESDQSLTTKRTASSPQTSGKIADATDLKFYDHIAQEKLKTNNNNDDDINADMKDSSIVPTVSEANDGKVAKNETEIKPVDDGKNSPRPARISGSLLKNSNRIVVRPIAFRPVMPGKRHESSSPESASFTPISYDEGYSSYDPSSGACSNSASTMSKDSDIVYASPIQISIRKDLETHDECPMIVNGDFDRLLQEKEAEILKLRRTMELNENAIVRVHEHKRVEWETQMKDLAEEYHRRLRAQQDTKHDRESDLRQIIVQLEIDNRQLAINVQQNKIDQDRQEHLSAQLAELKQRNTELNNRLTRELCECDRLRQQNKDLDIQIRKLQEQQSLGTREQDRLVKTINELEDQKCEADRENSLTIGQLQQQIKKQELQLADDKEKFKGEKRKWQDEKEKVMQYQKQLQRTYAQMYKRNHELEQQLCRINARRLARLETQSLQMQMDRHSLLEVDLESCPESFC